MADLTSTSYKKELESLSVNVRKATVRRKLNTGSTTECIGNKVLKMTDHGGQKKQKRTQHPKTAVAVGNFLPLHVGVNSQLGVGKWVLIKYHYQTGNRDVYYIYLLQAETSEVKFSGFNVVCPTSIEGRYLLTTVTNNNCNL